MSIQSTQHLHHSPRRHLAVVGPHFVNADLLT